MESCGGAWRPALRGCGPLEAISDAGLGEDEARANRIVLQLAAQAAHIDAQVLLGIAGHIPPHRAKQLRVRHCAAVVLDQGSQQVPLGPRQMDGLRVASRGRHLEVECDAAQHDRRVGRQLDAAEARRTCARIRARNSSEPNGFVT